MVSKGGVFRHHFFMLQTLISFWIKHSFKHYKHLEFPTNPSKIENPYYKCLPNTSIFRYL